MNDAFGPGDVERPNDGNEAIRATFDWASTSPSTAVIETVAAVSDSEPMAIVPLYEAVDPDALDSLVVANGQCSSRSGPTVTFGFAGYDVSVRGDGTVAVQLDGTQTGGE